MKRVFFNVLGEADSYGVSRTLNRYCKEHPGVTIESVQFCMTVRSANYEKLAACGVMLVPDDLITPWEEPVGNKSEGRTQGNG